MMVKKILFIAVILVLVLQGYSQKVGKQEAATVAEKFLEQQSSGKRAFSADKMSVQDLKLEGKTVAKLVTPDKKGFVLLATDKSRFPVIGYSLKNSLNPGQMPENLKNWLKNNVNHHTVSSKMHPWWSKIRNKKLNNRQRSFPVVNEMLTSKWGQDWSYNAQCPEHPKGPHGHCLAGCVATAMAQVMNYWEHPDTGKGSETYFWGSDSTVHFDQANYNWPNMGNYINATNRDDIAELIFHSAVSAKMNFGPNASGSSISYAADALKDHFKYVPTLKFIRKSKNYSYEEWRMIMQNEILNGRPVLYAGVANNGYGHAFVMDGFKDSCFFHFNWGWSGSGNGYFHLNNMNVAGYNFSNNHRAVIGIMPPGTRFCGEYWMTAPGYEFDDGSGYSFYQKNSDCSYLIEHPVNAPVKLQFTKWKLADAGDKLKIYDGKNENAPLLKKFNGTQIPSTVKSSGNQVYIKFETDSSGQDNGWKIKYSTTATDVKSRQDQSLSIYPNPVNKKLFVSGVNNGIINLYSPDGRLMISKKAQLRDRQIIDVSGLAAGVYVLRVEDSVNFVGEQKVIIH